MLATGILHDDRGPSGLGPEGDRRFGRRHFLDLVAAFSTLVLTLARHGGQELGLIHPAVLSQPGGLAPTNLLGGRAQRVAAVDWTRRVVDAVPSAD